MSEADSVGTNKTAPTKQPTSPARNIIGLIVLIGVLVFGWFEVSAKRGFNSAVEALNARAQDENQLLLTLPEAEKLLGREPDGPAAEFKEGPWSFTTRTYTWPGLLNRYTLTAYYTTEKDPKLHHYETAGQKYDLEQKAQQATTPPEASDGPQPKGQSRKSGRGKSAPAPQPKIAPDSKSPPAGPDDKGSTDKAQPAVDKAPAGKPSEPSDKGSTDKAQPAADKAPAGKPSEPSDKGSTDKP